MYFLKIYGLFFVLITNSFASQMDVLHEWKYVDFLWKNEAQKQTITNTGFRNTSIPLDVDEAPDGRLFVTVVGTKPVPASVNTVTNLRGEGGPILKPYPDWSWYENKSSCSGIISVFRVAIKCNHLWVLDNGKFGAANVCPAKLLVFNLANDKLVQQISIPNSVAEDSNGTGLLINPIVQISSCRNFNPSVYIAEVDAGGLVVYNAERRVMWRLEGAPFRAEPEFVNHTVAGETFNLPDALFGMALSPPWLGPQYLAFTSLSSRSLYTAYTSDIKNSYFTNSLRYAKKTNIFPSEVTTMAFSSSGVLFYGLTKEIAIGCWDSYKQLIPENLVTASQNNKTLQFTSGMKVVHRGGERLLIVTNRFQKFYLETMNFNEVNFRILQKSVRSLIFNTKCESYRRGK